jgi:hypothetical protein
MRFVLFFSLLLSFFSVYSQVRDCGISLERSRNRLVYDDLVRGRYIVQLLNERTGCVRRDTVDILGDCLVPRNLRYVLSGTLASVSWEGDDWISDYEVRLTEDNKESVMYVNGNNFSFRVTLGHNYKVEVRSVCGLERTAWSEALTVVPPSRPVCPGVEDIWYNYGDGSINFKFDSLHTGFSILIEDLDLLTRNRVELLRPKFTSVVKHNLGLSVSRNYRIWVSGKCGVPYEPVSSDVKEVNVVRQGDNNNVFVYTVYPNPAHTVITVYFNSLNRLNKVVRWMLLDLSGNFVKEGYYYTTSNAEGERLNIDVSDVRVGRYGLYISSELGDYQGLIEIKRD